MLAIAPAAMLSFSAPVTLRPAAVTRGSSLQMDVMSTGVSTETGNKVWDPLKLADKMDESNLNLIRAAELKHGRVAMLATVGWAWTATGAHFEGMLSTSQGVSFADAAASGNPIVAASMVPAAGVWQMILAIGALEVRMRTRLPARGGTRKGPVGPMTAVRARLVCAPIGPQGRTADDRGVGRGGGGDRRRRCPRQGLACESCPLPCLQVTWENKYPATECAGNFGVPAVTSDPAKLAELELIELKHGRLAMIGIISFACGAAIPGSVPFYPF